MPRRDPLAPLSPSAPRPRPAPVGRPRSGRDGARNRRSATPGCGLAPAGEAAGLPRIQLEGLHLIEGEVQLEGVDLSLAFRFGFVHVLHVVPDTECSCDHVAEEADQPFPRHTDESSAPPLDATAGAAALPVGNAPTAPAAAYSGSSRAWIPLLAHDRTTPDGMKRHQMTQDDTYDGIPCLAAPTSGSAPGRAWGFRSPLSHQLSRAHLSLRTTRCSGDRVRGGASTPRATTPPRAPRRTGCGTARSRNRGARATPRGYPVR